MRKLYSTVAIHTWYLEQARLTGEYDHYGVQLKLVRNMDIYVWLAYDEAAEVIFADWR